MPDIEIQWEGSTYRIPERDTFKVMADVEDHLTLSDLHAMQKRPNFSRLALAFSAVLSHAGVNEEPRTIRQKLMRAFTNGEGGQSQAAIQTIMLLMRLLTDGLEQELVGEGDEKKPEAPAKMGDSSKPSTKSG